jgi:hypothetical protein
MSRGKKGTQVHPRNPENSKLRNCLLPVPDLVFRYYNYNYKKQYSTLYIEHDVMFGGVT